MRNGDFACHVDEAWTRGLQSPASSEIMQRHTRNGVTKTRDQSHARVANTRRAKTVCCKGDCPGAGWCNLERIGIANGCRWLYGATSVNVLTHRFGRATLPLTIRGPCEHKMKMDVLGGKVQEMFRILLISESGNEERKIVED